MKQSSLFSLNWQDVAKGLIMAALGGMISIISDDINKGVFDINIIALWHGALVGGTAYIVKNFFTPSASGANVAKP